MNSEQILDQLEAELKALLFSIEQVRKERHEIAQSKWGKSGSTIIGAMKHRCVALKQTLTLAQTITAPMVENELRHISQSR
jgi:hypothetical protein